MEFCSSDSTWGVLGHAQGALIPLLGNAGSQLLARSCKKCLNIVQEIPQQFDNHSICIKKPACLELDKKTWISRKVQVRIDAFAVLTNSDLLICNDMTSWYQCLNASNKIIEPLKGILESSFPAPCHIRGQTMNAQRTHLFVVECGLVKKYKLTKSNNGRILQKSPTLLPDFEELEDVQLCELSPDSLLVLESGCMYTLDSEGVTAASQVQKPQCIATNLRGNVALCYSSHVKLLKDLNDLNNERSNRTLELLIKNPLQIQVSVCGKVIHVLNSEGVIQTFWSHSKTSQRQCNAKCIFLSGNTLFYVTRDNSIHMLL